ncbi:hypothetical protein HQ533_05515 [Candidatus Woesearchaeota archaeon]|nr:hypothetical protein [Candidatus Woesearchaeota archaeon]
MHKKGQAALEFLTTYGWAFLVILVMIGALAYFGVLNPSRFVPDTCTFSGTFMCEDAVAAAGSVTVKLRNNVEAITLTEIRLIDTDSATTYTIDAAGEWDDGITLGCGIPDALATTAVCNAGEVFQVVFNLASSEVPAAAFIVGTKKKFSVDFDYYVTTSGATFTKSTGGDIVGTVQ